MRCEFGDITVLRLHCASTELMQHLLFAPWWPLHVLGKACTLKQQKHQMKISLANDEASSSADSNGASWNQQRRGEGALLASTRDVSLRWWAMPNIAATCSTEWVIITGGTSIAQRRCAVTTSWHLQGISSFFNKRLVKVISKQLQKRRKETITTILRMMGRHRIAGKIESLHNIPHDAARSERPTSSLEMEKIPYLCLDYLVRKKLYWLWF